MKYKDITVAAKSVKDFESSMVQLTIEPEDGEDVTALVKDLQKKCRTLTDKELGISEARRNQKRRAS